MSVFALGLNHVTAPVDIRGRFAFTLAQLAPTLKTFQHQMQGLTRVPPPHPLLPPEAALLSTCNRTELYCATSLHMLDAALDWFACTGGVNREALKQHVYVRQDSDAARHAFRVASGLDSMVLGEPQILGQMKQAIHEAHAAGTLGTTLHQLFQRSFAVAKEVRSSTEIGAHSISMAAATVRLAARLFEDISDICVLFVGAGDMIELCATHFAAQAPRLMAVANRTQERAENMARQFGAQGFQLADLPHRLHEFDAVISCTASAVPIIGLGAVERALKARRHRPIFMVDLAVPRDIEPEAGLLDDIYLYTVDDLSTLVQTAGAKRQAAVTQAEAIIETGVQSFAHWLDQRRIVPLIQSLHQQTKLWQDAELARAKKQIAQGLDPEQVMNRLCHGLSQKILHGTLAELHRASPSEQRPLSEIITRLFLQGRMPADRPQSHPAQPPKHRRRPLPRS